MAFSRLVRFVPRGAPNTVLLGEPVDEAQDVGVATRKGDEVKVKVFSGTSALDVGSPTGKIEVVERLLCPLTQREVGTIRCIGLNVGDWVCGATKLMAEESTSNMPKRCKWPSQQSRLFSCMSCDDAWPAPLILRRKPATALADPFPAPTIIPNFTLADDCADYESELAIILSKDCKNVSEADAPSYILGYSAANDVSSRKTQLSQSQWCFSKGFDGACPVGPTIVSPKVLPDVSVLRMKGSKNGVVKQDCGIEYVLFFLPVFAH